MEARAPPASPPLLLGLVDRLRLALEPLLELLEASAASSGLGGLPWKPKRPSIAETPLPFLVWQTIAAGRSSVRLRSSASTIAAMS